MNNETVMINKEFLKSFLGKNMEVLSVIIDNSVPINNELVCILTQEEISKLINLSYPQTKRIFKKLLNSNLILKKGVGKYVLNKEAKEFLAMIKEVYYNE